jgi:hypothetical protein
MEISFNQFLEQDKSLTAVTDRDQAGHHGRYFDPDEARRASNCNLLAGY